MPSTLFKDWLEKLEPGKVLILAKEMFEKTNKFDLNSMMHLMQGEERAQLELILNHYTIEYLGGGNSKNFMITDVLTGEKCVFKLENRMNNPDTYAKRMEGIPEVSDHLVKVFANVVTQVQGDPRGYSERYLQVTEFCQGHDLSTRAEEDESIEERLLVANKIYIQMIDVLAHMKNHGVFHSDMKNSNWLLDVYGNLKMADTKALCPITINDNQFSLLTLREQGFFPVTSSQICPPELMLNILNDADTPLSVNRTTAFIFGKNLYEFLVTNSSTRTSAKVTEFLMAHHNGGDYDFSDPIFQTLEGARYS